MAANVTIASQQEKLKEKGTKIISLARRVVDLERRVSELEEHPDMDGKKCYWTLMMKWCILVFPIRIMCADASSDDPHQHEWNYFNREYLSHYHL